MIISNQHVWIFLKLVITYYSVLYILPNWSCPLVLNACIYAFYISTPASIVCLAKNLFFLVIGSFFLIWWWTGSGFTSNALLGDSTISLSSITNILDPFPISNFLYRFYFILTKSLLLVLLKNRLLSWPGTG